MTGGFISVANIPFLTATSRQAIFTTTLLCSKTIPQLYPGHVTLEDQIYTETPNEVLSLDEVEQMIKSINAAAVQGNTPLKFQSYLLCAQKIVAHNQDSGREHNLLGI